MKRGLSKQLTMDNEKDYFEQVPAIALITSRDKVAQLRMCRSKILNLALAYYVRTQ